MIGKIENLDFAVPSEYIINSQIKDKLAPIDLSRYNEDTLFFLFYMSTGDLMQLQAASMLYDRDWRYHREKRLWITKVPGLDPHQKTPTFERGYYSCFDPIQWKKLQLEMTIEYSKVPYINTHAYYYSCVLMNLLLISSFHTKNRSYMKIKIS